MGYDCSFERDPDAPGARLRMNSAQMSMMREFMREVGAISDPGLTRALAGPPPAEGSAPIQKFTSNGNWLVSPEECQIIAARLRDHMDIVVEVGSFFDDAPPAPALREWVLEWVDYNTRAAANGGYRVR